MLWEYPSFLWLLLLLPVLAAGSAWMARRRRKTMRRFFSDALISQMSNQAWPAGKKLQTVFLYAGLTLLIIGAAGPKIGSEIREVTREGVDLMIALDVSRGMNAEDVRPNRLDKARFEIASLIDRLEGDRVGLILFTNTAFLQCPLTTDYSAFNMYLDLASPDQFPTKGTDFNAPLREALRAFEDRSAQQEDAARVLLFFSDGEDHSPSFDRQLEALQEAGVYIYTVGIGTPSGAPIPLYDENTGRRTGFFNDRQGERVITRLESDNLRRMAEAGRGQYYEIRRGNDRLENFTRQLAELERREFASEQFSDYANRYQYPTAAGLLLLCLYFMIPVYKSARVS